MFAQIVTTGITEFTIMQAPGPKYYASSFLKSGKQNNIFGVRFTDPRKDITCLHQPMNAWEKRHLIVDNVVVLLAVIASGPLDL